MVKPKKHLGQHFLKDKNIAEKIVNSLNAENIKDVIEIGAGTGILTDFLLKKDYNLHIIEIDTESIDYLKIFIESPSRYRFVSAGVQGHHLWR